MADRYYGPFANAIPVRHYAMDVERSIDCFNYRDTSPGSSYRGSAALGHAESRYGPLSPRHAWALCTLTTSPWTIRSTAATLKRMEVTKGQASQLSSRRPRRATVACMYCRGRKVIRESRRFKRGLG